MLNTPLSPTQSPLEPLSEQESCCEINICLPCNISSNNNLNRKWGRDPALPVMSAHADSRMYESKYPDVDDVVMVQVKSIAEMGAYVSLLEYNGIEGMILLSELSRRRIRSITKLIKVRMLVKYRFCMENVSSRLSEPSACCRSAGKNQSWCSEWTRRRATSI